MCRRYHYESRAYSRDRKTRRIPMTSALIPALGLPAIGTRHSYTRQGDSRNSTDLARESTRRGL
eukprot:3619451-Rhodomonas_salina.1